MQAYIDWLEASGARVVPLLTTDDISVNREKLTKLNGVLFPGGDTDYLDLGNYIYNFAIQENDAGRFYPIWGTCLGFENLAIFASDSKSPLSNLESDEHSLILNFYEDPLETGMFSLSDDPHYYEKEAMTYNSHSFGLSPDVFKTDKGLSKMFIPTSWSHDEESGDTFVASMESADYPFYAT